MRLLDDSVPDVVLLDQGLGEFLAKLFVDEVHDPGVFGEGFDRDGPPGAHLQVADGEFRFDDPKRLEHHFFFPSLAKIRMTAMRMMMPTEAGPIDVDVSAAIQFMRPAPPR